MRLAVSGGGGLLLVAVPLFSVSFASALYSAPGLALLCRAPGAALALWGHRENAGKKEVSKGRKIELRYFFSSPSFS